VSETDLVLPPSSDLVPSAAGRDPVAYYLASYSAPNTKATLQAALERVARVANIPFDRMPWAQLGFAQTNVIRGRLLERYRPAGVRLTLTALSGLLKTCWRLELISHEAYARAVDWPKAPFYRIPAGRYLPDEDLRKMAAWAKKQEGPYGAMLRAVLSLLAGCGLRATELCTVLLAGYSQKDKTLQVMGKGSKPAEVPLGDPQVATIESWLQYRKPDQPRLLHHVQRVGEGAKPRRRVQVRPMTRRDLLVICDVLAKETGLQHFTPHDFRRTWVTSTLDKGLDLLVVQRLARHASVTTTQIYDRREALMDAEKRRSVTYPIDDVFAIG
jgi:integrase/recombinase XerD